MNVVTEKKVPSGIRYVVTLDLSGEEAAQLMADLRDASLNASPTAIHIRNALYKLGIEDKS